MIRSFGIRRARTSESDSITPNSQYGAASSQQGTRVPASSGIMTESSQAQRLRSLETGIGEGERVTPKLQAQGRMTEVKSFSYSHSTTARTLRVHTPFSPESNALTEEAIKKIGFAKDNLQPLMDQWKSEYEGQGKGASREVLSAADQQLTGTYGSQELFQFWTDKSSHYIKSHILDPNLKGIDLVTTAIVLRGQLAEPEEQGRFISFRHEPTKVLETALMKILNLSLDTDRTVRQFLNKNEVPERTTAIYRNIADLERACLSQPHSPRWREVIPVGRDEFLTFCAKVRPTGSVQLGYIREDKKYIPYLDSIMKKLDIDPGNLEEERDMVTARTNHVKSPYDNTSNEKTYTLSTLIFNQQERFKIEGEQVPLILNDLGGSVSPLTDYQTSSHDFYAIMEDIDHYLNDMRIAANQENTPKAEQCVKEMVHLICQAAFPSRGGTTVAEIIGHAALRAIDSPLADTSIFNGLYARGLLEPNGAYLK